MGEMILLFYLAIFCIRHYRKLSITREIRIDRVFPSGPRGIWNLIVGQWGRVAAQLDQELVPFHKETP